MGFRIQKLLLAGVLLVAGASATVAQERMDCSTNPQPTCRDVGVTSTISGGILPPPGTFTFRAVTPSFFTILKGSCCGAILTPAAWNSGDLLDPDLGSVYWEIDTDPTLARCEYSTLTPNQPKACFPSTGRLFYWIKGKILGRTVRSKTCIEVWNGNLTSCGPFNCERFVLVNGPIPFIDIDTGEWVFDLVAQTVVLDN